MVSHRTNDAGFSFRYGRCAAAGHGMFAVVFAFLAMTALVLAETRSNTQDVHSPIWTVPEIGAIPDDRLVPRGRDLITATYAYIGPKISNVARRYAGNNLACSNCHLDAGTKKFAIPMFGLFEQFPQYSAQSGAKITIEDRVNSCMQRSMNGHAMPLDDPQMPAIIAYIKF